MEADGWSGALWFSIIFLLELRQEGVEPCARAPANSWQDSRNLPRTEGRRYAQIPFGRTSALRSKERKSSLKILRQRISTEFLAVNFLLSLADHAWECWGIDRLVTTRWQEDKNDAEKKPDVDPSKASAAWRTKWTALVWKMDLYDMLTILLSECLSEICSQAQQGWKASRTVMTSSWSWAPFFMSSIS